MNIRGFKESMEGKFNERYILEYIITITCISIVFLYTCGNIDKLSENVILILESIKRKLHHLRLKYFNTHHILDKSKKSPHISSRLSDTFQLIEFDLDNIHQDEYVFEPIILKTDKNIQIKLYATLEYSLPSLNSKILP